MVKNVSKRRPDPLYDGPKGPLVVECRHMSGPVEEIVRRWFDGGIDDFTLDGERSVRFAHPTDKNRIIKIKGAGFKGGPVHFGNRMNSGLRAPVFDYEGRMMDDAASTHDNAFLGGASFQQCAVEHCMTSRLQALGYQAVDCLGYGSVACAGFVSWFSVFELSSDLHSLKPPAITGAEYLDAKYNSGVQARELAVTHGLIGYFWYMRADNGGLVLKDLHPFRHAHPVNMSRMSWTMQVFFALHIAALSAAHYSRDWGLDDLAEDAPAVIFRAFYPSATKADHDAVRFTLVGKYIRSVPEPFDPDALHRFLLAHALTRSILEACPDDYASYL